MFPPTVQQWIFHCIANRQRCLESGGGDGGLDGAPGKVGAPLLRVTGSWCLKISAFQSRLPSLRAVWLCLLSTSLCLSFTLLKMGTVTVPTSWGVEAREPRLEHGGVGGLSASGDDFYLLLAT